MYSLFYRTQPCLLFFLMVSVILRAQGVGIGTPVPHTSAALEISSTQAGLLPPRLTGAERNAIANPAAGLVIFNKDNFQLEVFNGSYWVSLSAGTGQWGQKQALASESGASAENLLYSSTENGVAGKYLGQKLATRDSILVAAAPGDFNFTGTVIGAGTVRFYKKSNQQWIPYNTIAATDQTKACNFGSALAIDNNLLVVGASRAEVLGVPTGKVYFYTLSAAGEPVLINAAGPSLGQSSGYFGSSVAASGNYVLMGAHQYDALPKIDQGAAFVFHKLGANWVQHSMLQPSDGQADDLFGSSVALSGNYAAIAAVQKNNRRGKVYIFQNLGNQWTEVSAIDCPAGGTLNRFGSALLLHGDSLFVGSSEFNGVIANQTGKVYLYVRSGNNWNLVSSIVPQGASWGEGFGSSLSLKGDHLLVGAPQANVKANNGQGKAYVFRKMGSVWVQEAVLCASNGNSAERFGTALVLSAGSAVVAAPYAAFQGNEQHGRIYYFEQ